MKDIKSEKSEWPITANRFVAVLDIMGFTDLVARRPHEEVVSSFKTLLSMTDENINLFNGALEIKDYSIRKAAFSDTIVFISKGDSLSDLQHMAHNLWTFQLNAFSLQLPTKGAVSHGMVTADFDSSIYVGQPIIDAFLLQGQLHYYGVILDNHTDKRIATMEDWLESGLREEVIEEQFPKEDTPLKGARVIHRNLKLGIEHLNHIIPLYFMSSGLIRKYVENTEDMILKFTNNVQ
jgi:hypothetical protein